MNDISDASPPVSQPAFDLRGERYWRLKRIHAIRMLLLYVVPFIVLTVYFLFQYETILAEGERVHLQAKAEEQASVLDLFLSERLVNLSQLMADPAFRLRPTATFLEEGLRRLKADSDTFVDLSFIDGQGVQTAYIGPYEELVGRDYSSQAWYSELRDHDLDHLVTDIYQGFRRRLHITIAMRKSISDGSVVVLRTTLEPSKIREGIRPWANGSDVTLSVVNRGGDHQLPDVTSSDAEEPVVIPPNSPRSGTGNYTHDGGQKSYAFAWLRTADWAVVARTLTEPKWGAFLGFRAGILFIVTAVALIVLFFINIQAGKLAVTHLESETAKSQLTERAKELACLYGIGRLVERYEVSLDEVLRGAVELVRGAFKDPASTSVRILLGDREFVTDGWKETPLKMSADININRERVGGVDVCVLEELHGEGEDPFLIEERELLDAVAERLGKTVSRKRTEDLQRLLMTAIEQAAESITITDTSGAIEYVNPAFSRISGYEQEEVIGQNSRILKSGRHDRVFYQELWQTILGGKTWEGRFINRRKDDTFYEVDCRISPVRDEQGKIINFVAVKHDVTEMVKLESDLRQAQKMEAIGQLAGGVAHDFNNLLTVILTNCHYLLRAVDDSSPLRQDIDEIKQSGERAAALTRQLLAFSRRQVLEPRVVDLNQVLDDTQKMLRRLIGEDVELVVVPGPDVGRVFVDPAQIEQVILNLAVNARDAMPNGGKLTIETSNAFLDEGYARLRDDVQPGTYVMLAVSDTGCGMDEETRSRIFEPFFTTKDQGKGTGLGLATVYGIVNQCGGHIWVYSELDKGSVFKNYFPMVETDEQLARAGEEASDVFRGTENILVVEDDELVRRTAVRILREHKYTVFEASDGKEALEVCRRDSDGIQLVLCDVVMPGLSGIELSRLVTAMHPAIKVVLMSGYTEKGRKQFDEADADVVLVQKPLVPSELARKVREVLDGNKK